MPDAKDSRSPPRLDLATLLALVRAGDGEAWGKLLEQLRPYLMLLCAAQISRRLTVKAEPSDLVQEAILQAHRKFHTFRGTTGEEFAAWMEALLASRVEKLVRRYYHTAARDLRIERQLRDAFSESSRQIAIIDPNDTPTRIAASREQAIRVALAVDQLSPEQREVILLRHLDALTFPQIGERLKKSTDAVTQIWVRAVRKLRELLEGKRD